MRGIQVVLHSRWLMIVHHVMSLTSLQVRAYMHV